jgi:hypothetical protein
MKAKEKNIARNHYLCFRLSNTENFRLPNSSKTNAPLTYRKQFKQFVQINLDVLTQWLNGFDSNGWS